VVSHAGLSKWRIFRKHTRQRFGFIGNLAWKKRRFEREESDDRDREAYLERPFDWEVCRLQIVWGGRANALIRKLERHYRGLVVITTSSV
jgi:hypothetical protein